MPLQVQLKTLSRYHIVDPRHAQSLAPLKVGDFVIIDADRGEDLGIVTEVLSMAGFTAKQFRGTI